MYKIPKKCSIPNSCSLSSYVWVWVWVWVWMYCMRMWCELFGKGRGVGDYMTADSLRYYCTVQFDSESGSSYPYIPVTSVVLAAMFFQPIWARSSCSSPHTLPGYSRGLYRIIPTLQGRVSLHTQQKSVVVSQCLICWLHSVWYYITVMKNYFW